AGHLQGPASTFRQSDHLLSLVPSRLADGVPVFERRGHVSDGRLTRVRPRAGAELGQAGSGGSVTAAMTVETLAMSRPAALPPYRAPSARLISSFMSSCCHSATPIVTVTGRPCSAASAG